MGISLEHHQIKYSMDSMELCSIYSPRTPNPLWPPLCSIRWTRKRSSWSSRSPATTVSCSWYPLVTLDGLNTTSRVYGRLYVCFSDVAVYFLFFLHLVKVVPGVASVCEIDPGKLFCVNGHFVGRCIIWKTAGSSNWKHTGLIFFWVNDKIWDGFR